MGIPIMFKTNFSLKYFINLFIAFQVLCSTSVAITLDDNKKIGFYTKQDQGGLKISTFDIDVIPPVGGYLPYDKQIKTWDLGLRAKGIVLLGSGNPIVLCAIDWLLISNEGM